MSRRGQDTVTAQETVPQRVGAESCLGREQEQQRGLAVGPGGLGWGSVGRAFEPSKGGVRRTVATLESQSSLSSRDTTVLMGDAGPEVHA